MELISPGLFKTKSCPNKAKHITDVSVDFPEPFLPVTKVVFVLSNDIVIGELPIDLKFLYVIL